MYRIKVTRRDGRIVYIKRTWPECFVTENSTEAFLFYSLGQAEAYIEGESDAEVETVNA